MTLVTSPNPSIFGAPVVLTATVTPPNATGRVTFYDGVAILGTAPLVSGRSSISTILLPAGSRKLRAYYTGDNAAATSNVVTERVNAVPVTNFVAGSTFPDLAQSFVADFNGDGIADIARGYSGNVYLGDGKGNFRSAFAVGSLIVAVGDFKGDGKTDLVTGSGVLLGNGDGTFQSPIANSAVVGSTPVVVADFNGDGKADLATGSGVQLGNGDGSFQPAIGLGIGFLWAMVAADFNGDGIPDLAAADGSNTTILLGNGNGTFRPSNQPPIPTQTFGLATADFNGDGIPDLATINSVPGSSSLDIYLGKGDGTFHTPQASTPPGGQYRSDYILAGDFNGDGIVDLLLNSSSTNQSLQYDSILLGNGDGTFQTPASFPGGFRQYALLADFNGDGKPDLLFDTGLLFGTSTTILPAGGTTQSATVGTPFAAPLAVIVRDNGVPVSGATVTFRTPLGGPTATLSSTTAVTNASGVASVTATANPLAGTYTVTAGYQSGVVSFSLTNTNIAGPPASITASGGTPQSTAVGTAFRNPLQATVKDSAGNPVAGATVTFAMPGAGPSAAGAVLSSTTAVTNASGVASVTATANLTPGSYVVTATVGAVAVAFSLTNLLAASVNLSTNPNPSVFGAPVTLTATVTPSNVPGRVTFYDGVTILGTRLLSAGTASISTILLPAGTRRLTALYNGGVNYVSPTSNIVTQRVNAVAGGGFLVQSPLSVSPAAPTSVAVGDFNGDGRADFVSTGGTGSSTVTVVLGRGDGSFQTPINYPVGANPRFVAVGDFDGDGIPDLAVTGSALNILLGNGDGTFRQGASYSAAALPVSVADFNGDGIADLAVGGTIWIGNGDGTFHPLVVTTATVEKSAVSDFNGDGKADLVLTAPGCFTLTTGMGHTQTFCTDYASVYLGNGDGTFQSPLVAFQSQTEFGPPLILVFTVGDFNGDGKPDFAYWDSVALEFLPGNGDGTFGPPIRISASVGGTVTSLTSGDFNGDGIIDLAVIAVTNSVSTVNLLAGNGDGTFQSLGNQAAAGSADALSVADFNGDGRADLVIANAAGGSMSVLLGAASGSGYQLTVAGGTPQSARTGGAFAVPLAVTVRNNGVPASGVTVTFAAPNTSFLGSAILSSATAVTNASGVASVTAIANEYTGSYVVTATAQGLIVSFSLTNTGTQLVGVTPFGTPQSTSVGTAFPTALEVTVKDYLGNPASGVVVRFTAPGSGASAVLSSATAVTNAYGVASVTATANSIAGSYAVTAIVGDGSGGLSGQFSLTNLSEEASRIWRWARRPPKAARFPGYATAGAASAVDGNTDGNFFDGSVTATNLDPNAWWQVDLGASATVSSIVIWNRTDCCGSRLSDYWVFVSDTPFLATDTPATLQNRAGTFGSHQTTAPNPSTTIAAGGAQGRYVRVQLTGTDYLSLAEVQVFGTGGCRRPRIWRRVRRPPKAARFRDTPPRAPPSAVDGNTDGNFFDGSVTATNLDPNPWWQVDLGASATVNSIVDLEPHRLLRLAAERLLGVRFGHPVPRHGHARHAAEPGRDVRQPSDRGAQSIHDDCGRRARPVCARATHRRELSEPRRSAGVRHRGGRRSRIWRRAKRPPKAARFRDIPPRAPPRPWMAITDGNFFDGSVTATNLDPNAWWQVDLGASAAVSSIVVWNRTDCCGSRLNDYWVFVSDTPFLATDTPATLQNRAGTFSSHQTAAPNPSTAIAAGAQGRYVRVQLTGTNYLSLAEVQVFGQ